MYDIENKKVEIGDLIYRCRSSGLQLQYVLGFTNKNIILSCSRGNKHIYTFNSNYTIEDVPNSEGKGSIISWGDKSKLENHNSKQYVYFYKSKFLIKEKNAIIPDKLKSFIK